MRDLFPGVSHDFHSAYRIGMRLGDIARTVHVMITRVASMAGMPGFLGGTIHGEICDKNGCRPGYCMKNPYRKPDDESSISLGWIGINIDAVYLQDGCIAILSMIICIIICIMSMRS